MKTVRKRCMQLDVAFFRVSSLTVQIGFHKLSVGYMGYIYGIHGCCLTLLLIDHLKPFKISTFKNAHCFCTHMVITFEQCW